MHVASLKSTYPRNANLLKIVKVDGKAYWRNPNNAEHWGVGDEGVSSSLTPDTISFLPNMSSYIYTTMYFPSKRRIPSSYFNLSQGMVAVSPVGPIRLECVWLTAMKMVSCLMGSFGGMIFLQICPISQLIFVNANRRILLLI
jgi:hypothetical protein